MRYRTIGVLCIAMGLLLLCGLPRTAAAQNDTDAIRAMYQTSATIPSTIPGINRFPDPPVGFDPVAASDMELAMHGFPPRPDAQTDPNGYAHWVLAMKSARKRWNGELKLSGKYHGPMRDPQVVAASATENANAPKSATSQNWSAVILTNTLTKYNTSNSFYFLESYFNVPFAQEAFNVDYEGGNVCDGGYDQVSVWNGIDGSGLAKAGNGDVLQAGTDSYVYCSGGSTTHYEPYAWIEWFPAGEVVEFGVNTGDDMYVETVETSTTTGYFFLEDLTLQVYDLLTITAPSGTSLVGSSAEWVVERPGYLCGKSICLYPLANYVMEFNAGGVAYTNADHVLYPGNQSITTFLSTMLDGSTAISYPQAGSAGIEGNGSITFFDENCANTGGC
jgi:Peptidase A4 family